MQSRTKGHIVRQAKLFYPTKSPMLYCQQDCPTKIDIVPPSVRLPLAHGWQLLNSLWPLNLILDSLTLHLPYYFSCAATPWANLSTMCSRMVTTHKVSDNSIPRMFAEGLQYTKPNVREYVVSEIRWLPLHVRHYMLTITVHYYF